MHWKVALSLVLLLLVGFGLISILNLSEVHAQVPYSGPWVGEVRFYEEPDTAIAVEKLIAGHYDIHFDDIDSATIFRRVQEAKLPYAVSYGLYYEITLNYRCVQNETTGEIIEPVFPNPSKLPRPEVEGKILFNPFCNRRIRYAVHFLMNREFMAEKIAEGLAVPRYTSITPAFPDYGRYADIILAIERELAYNLAKARDIVFEEMPKMGAELREGRWYYKGEPVVLIFLIRTEDVRKDIGDYVASQLERLGFTVLRVYGTSAMLAPYWIRADPDDGTFHLYTGGWITTIVSRDQGSTFGYFYSKLGRPEPLWQKIINTPEFYEVAEKLYYNKFKTLEERRELFEKALWLSVTVENQRIFILHRIAAWARRPNVVLAADLAGGYSGAWLWGWTIRFTDIPKEQNRDKTVRIAIPQLLVEPWNPIGGSNWIFDMTVIRATADIPYYYDPYSGLTWPQWIKKATVYVHEDLPVAKTLDWVDLQRVSEITVPDDAWLFYDCKGKKIWTWGEAKQNPNITQELFNVPYNFTEPPLVKVVVEYDDRLFTGVFKWHDGSPFSIADMVYVFTITFDRVCIGSDLYDSAAIPGFTAWFPTFKGIKIVSTNPLIIEWYSTAWYMDAEWIASDAADDIWPYYAQGPGAWHTVELFAQGERAKIVAFTTSKATALKVPRADFLIPPSQLIDQLRSNIDKSYVPYPEVLGKYLTPAEAKARWQNLLAWYDKYKHVWVANGPFYLESFTTAPKTIVLKANREHPLSAAKWEFLGEPPIPVIHVEVPSTIYRGREYAITLELTDKAGNPYPNEFVEFVSYVVIHEGGILSGKATPLAEGLWELVLTPELTGKLSVGVAEIRFIAVSKIIGLPSIEAKTVTITIPPEQIFEEITRVQRSLEEQMRTVQKSLEEQMARMREEITKTLGLAVASAIEDLGRTISDAMNAITGQVGTAMNVISSAVNAMQRSVDEAKSSIQAEISGVKSDLRGVETRLREENEITRRDVAALSTVVYAVIALVVVNLVVSIVTLIRRK
ncbi:MAG: ABC transporter substrate-binding protein [Desulfurococcaceae archaeon]